MVTFEKQACFTEERLNLQYIQNTSKPRSVNPVKITVSSTALDAMNIYSITMNLKL